MTKALMQADEDHEHGQNIEKLDQDREVQEIDMFQGPMTRSKTKELQLLVQGLLSQVQPTFKDGLTHPKVLSIIQAQNNVQPT